MFSSLPFSAKRLRRLTSAIVICIAGLGTVVRAAGPAPIPPGGATVVSDTDVNGQSAGRAGGRTITYHVNNIASFSTLSWGVVSGTAPGAAFDGSISPATTEVLAFDAGGSNLPAGIARWVGSMTFNGTSYPVRFTMTVSASTPALTFVGGSASPGVDVVANGGVFTVNLLYEANAGAGFVPFLQVYDAIALKAAGALSPNPGPALTSLQVGFYYTSTTTTALSSSANPSNFGQTVTFTAAVTSAIAGTITGTVTFKDAGTTLGTTSVSAGQAQYSTSTLTEGVHSITAVYNGDSAYATSTSSPLSQTVNPMSAPTDVHATATLSSVLVWSVGLTWTAVPGADHYEVFRTTDIGVDFMSIGQAPSANFTDNNVIPGTTYLYKVRAVPAAGTSSALSALDAATTVQFTDDPLIVGTTVVKAIHLSELRTAVNAFRAAAGLLPFAFTDPDPAGIPIRAVHITELRQALNDARSILYGAALSFTDPTLTTGVTVIKAVHVQEIRDGVK